MNNKVPNDRNGWFEDITQALISAIEIMPILNMANDEGLEQIFLLAPEICLKKRGLKTTKKNIEKAKEAALCSYVATKNNAAAELENPIIAFSLAYLASHFGLDLISDMECAQIMDAVEYGYDEILDELNKIML